MIILTFICNRSSNMTYLKYTSHHSLIHTLLLGKDASLILIVVQKQFLHHKRELISLTSDWIFHRHLKTYRLRYKSAICTESNSHRSKVELEQTMFEFYTLYLVDFFSVDLCFTPEATISHIKFLVKVAYLTIWQRTSEQVGGSQATCNPCETELLLCEVYMRVCRLNPRWHRS